MYAILYEIIKLDKGHLVEYPLDFIREILKVYKDKTTPKDILNNYKDILNHKYSDA
jgi:hypothetical protein